jgi:hypothetical protein
MKDTVSLSKDKRDDDLSEISGFRESVLKNSKMAQFWETKDELIKNVSISLMKQIMQKPGIGWVRGDMVGAEEALFKELTTLNKENRELREKIVHLESKISIKVPAVMVDIKSPKIDEKFTLYQKLEMPAPLNFGEVEKHLLDYISEQDVSDYNNSLPSQSELDKYNDRCEELYKIRNYSSPLVVEVSNSGSVKANNLFIDIFFPDEIYIYENHDKHAEPDSPIPFNPLKGAQAKYDNDKKEKGSGRTSLRLNPFGLGSGLDRSALLVQSGQNFPQIRPINKRWSTNLNGRKLTIRIDSLLHTRYMTFDDEYMITPLVSGNINIQVHTICEEYSELEVKVVELHI